MTDAQTAQPTQDPDSTASGGPWWWALLVQAAAYAILVVLACLPGAGSMTSVPFSFTAFAVAVMLVLSAFFSPLRDGPVGRAIAFALGLCSMVCACTGQLADFVFGPGDAPAAVSRMAATWMAGVAVLLVALVVIGFVRQMARRTRTDMIVHMAHMDADGIAAVCAAGWCFLPLLFHETAATDLARVAVAVLVVAVAILLGLLGRRWYADARPLPGAPAPWIGFGLLPVMLTGGVVGTAALVMSLL